MGEVPSTRLPFVEFGPSERTLAELRDSSLDSAVGVLIGFRCKGCVCGIVAGRTAGVSD